MAKMNLCDVCLSEGQYKESRWRTGFRQPHLKVDLCEEHKGWGKGLTPEEFDTAAITLLNGRPRG